MLADDEGKEGRGVEMYLPGFVGIIDAGVENAVQLEGHIIGRNGALAGDFYGRLFQTLNVGYSVDEGNEEGEAWAQNAVEFAHAFDDPCCLLGNEANDGVGR